MLNKKTVADFLKGHTFEVLIYPCLFFIELFDSTIALVLYGIIIHFVVILLIAGLYISEIIDNNSSTKCGPNFIIAALIMSGVLITTSHWYLLILSTICIFLLFIFKKKNEPNS